VEDYDRFITMVVRGTGVDRPAAERATRATIETLFERLSGGEARDLAEQLPREFVRPESIVPDRHPDPFDVEEFLRRIAEREPAGPSEAERDAVAVLTALRMAVTEREFADMTAQLPRTYDALLAQTAGPHVDIRTVAQFVEAVANGAGLDPDSARRASDAVLEALAERLPDREAADLVRELPPDLGHVIEEGRGRRPAPRRLSMDKFVRLVAEREGADPAEAHEHARAVFAALSRAVTDRQFYAIIRQLPDDYATLLPPVRR
jgi:uncharacterized protein (DUF2267 family)